MFTVMCYPHWIKLLPTYLPTYHRRRRKFDHKSSDWSVKRSATVFHRSSFYRCKHRIHQRVHIPNISRYCENCPEWKEASNCYRQRWARLTLKLFSVNFVQFWINFHYFKVRLSLDTDLIHILWSKKYCLMAKKPLLEFKNQQLLLSDSVTKRF